jgi:4,5-DOPA dioxygenase extradiol
MIEENKNKPAPVLYFPHGGGPLPLLGNVGHEKMIRFLQRMVPLLGRPDAILVVSAHWEELKPMVTSGKKPSLIYDYYGFPEEAYQIEYPVSGDPVLAEKLVSLIEAADQTAWRHSQRGFDHGLYIPLKIMYPSASIPCIQLSLISSLDSDDHIQLGKALANLRHENILVMGSGFSFHNLRAFGSGNALVHDSQNERFQEWLIETCTGEMSENEREKRLIAWESAPFARYCHPREEHLLPLHVCYGMTQSKAKQVFYDEIMGKKAVAFLWME